MRCKRLSCNGWAELDSVSIQPWHCCMSLEVDEVVVLGFLFACKTSKGLREVLQGLGGQDFLQGLGT